MKTKILFFAMMLLMVCGCESGTTNTTNTKEIVVLQGTTSITNKTGKFDFGNVFMGETSQEITFTIKNTGSDELILSGNPEMIQKDDDTTDSFSITQNLVVSPVSPENTTSFSISFKPTSTGVLSAKILIPNSSEGKNPYTFSVTGVGVQSFIWAKRMGGVDEDYGSSIISDSSGNIYITGDFLGTVDFGADFGVSDTKTSAGLMDIFITKINANGSYDWTKRIGGSSNDVCYSIKSDSSGNIFVTGFFCDTVDFGTDFGVSDSKTSVVSSDIFVTKINANGSYDWTKRMGGASTDGGSSISSDSSGNIYITGYFSDTVDFGADFGVSDIKTSAGLCDVFVTKINANGSYDWTKRMGGSDYEIGTSITTDLSGNTYITGGFRGTVDFGIDFGVSDIKTSAGLSDVFITKINANGSYGWSKRFGGTDNDSGSSITSDSSGDIYFTGYFWLTVDFGIDFGVSDTKISSGEADIFVTKIKANGTYDWTTQIGGIKGDCGTSIISGSSGNIYFTGSFYGSVDFGSDFGVYDNKTSSGLYDIFVTKINANGEYSWTKQMGGDGNDSSSSTTSDSGNIYITGGFYGTIIFGISDSKTSAGDNDIFVAKMSK